MRRRTAVTCRALAGGAVLVLGVGPAAAQTSVTVSVPGTSNPKLAGAPPGTTAIDSDAAPAQSPAQAFGLDLSAGAVLRFPSVTGAVGFAPGRASGPEGSFVGGNGPENGISGVTAPFESLLGVFLGPENPVGLAPPGSLSFATAASRDYLTLAPVLRQVFFIGDGRTSSGVVQEVVVPAGATRFYLAVHDGSGWYNNVGAFTVSVTSTAVVPEPSTVALLAAGLGVVGVAARRRRRVRTAP